MARRRRQLDCTTYHYDRQARLRAITSPHGVTRYQWDGVQLLNVNATPVTTPPANLYRFETRPSP